MKSSVITSVGYDAHTSTMDVEFTTGRIYRYRKVPSAIHASLISAESIGRYFNAKIRDRYPYRELNKPAS